MCTKLYVFLFYCILLSSHTPLLVFDLKNIILSKIAFRCLKCSAFDNRNAPNCNIVYCIFDFHKIILKNWTLMGSKFNTKNIFVKNFQCTANNTQHCLMVEVHFKNEGK